MATMNVDGGGLPSYRDGGRVSPKARSPVAFGPYIITRRIARGGMAEIYRARTRGQDPEQTRWVALKLMRSSIGHEDLRLRLFDREARIASRLDHENVVPIYEHGQEMGRPYLAMEYVRGRDLSHLLKNEKKGREVVPYELGLYVGLLAARGLGHAHRQTDEAGRPLDIVHRDISPGNVMVGYDGAVKVLDFGVARMNETQGFHTQTGTLRGKFAYMSPEQTLGEDLDARSDVFSLGTLLYELLTGINCFRAANPIATLERVQGLRPVPPGRANRHIPKSVDKILARCLAKDKRRRFADGLALADAIGEFLDKQGYVGRPELVAHMEASFSWEQHEETSELMREEEEVALFDVVDFALLSNPSELDAKNVAVSTEEEASQSQVENITRQGSRVEGTGVFEGEADPVSGEAEAEPARRPYQAPMFVATDEDATVAQPLPFEDQAHEIGQQVEVASLLLSAQPLPTDPPRPVDPSPRAPSLASPLPRGPTPNERPPRRGPNTQFDAAATAHAAPLVPKNPWRLRVAAGLLVLVAGGAAFALSRDPRVRGGLVEVEPTKLEPVRITLEPPEPVAARSPAPPPSVEALPEGDGSPADLPDEADSGPGERTAPDRAEPSRTRPRPKPAVRRPRRVVRKVAMGFLNVGAKPWAEIQIDGKRWPHQTPQAGIELKAGRHEVTLHNPETGVTRSTAVYIKPGAYRTVMMDMRKNR